MSKTIFMLLWEFWRSLNWRVGLALCAMLVLPGIMTFANIPRNTMWWSLSDLHPLIWQCQMAAIWTNFLICSLTVGYGVGFPTRHYTLPVSTRQFVLLRLMPGALVCGAMYLLFAILFNILFHSGFPYVGPALTYGVGYMLGYAVVSQVHGRENLKTLTCLAVGALIGYWIFGHYKTRWGFGSNFSWPVVSEMESIFIALTAVAAWIIAERSLVLDRKGHGWAQPGIPTEASSEHRSIHQRPVKRFRSPFAALFWMEWRQYGWHWPLALAGTYAVVVGLLLGLRIYEPREQLIGETSAEIATFTIPFMAMGASLPWFMGAVIAQRKNSLIDKPLPTFLGTLPVSDACFAWVSIVRNLSSVAMSWLCLILVGLAWALVRSLVDDGFEWSSLPQANGGFSFLIAALWVAGWLALIAWLTTGVGTATGLTGRTWIIYLPVSIIPVWIGVFLLMSLFESQTSSVLMLIALTMILMTLATGTLIAYIRAWNLKLIGIESVLAGIAILCVLEGLLLEFGYSRTPGRLITLVELSVFWCFGLFLALAAAPPAVVPLAMRFNRHR